MAATTQHSQKAAQTIGYYLAFIALGLVAAVLGPTLSELKTQTGTDLSQVSVLFTAWSLGYLSGSFFGGRLFDRMAGHPLMVLTLLLLAGATAVVPVIPALWLVAVAFFFVGAAGGTLDVGGNVLLVWVHGSRVGPYMNALHFFFGLGAFVSPIVVAQIMQRTEGLGWTFWTLALLALPAALWLLRLPSPPRQVASETETQAGGNRLLLVLLVLLFYLYVSAETSFAGWVSTYSVHQGLADETSAAYLTSAFWGALTVGRLLAIPIAARLSPRAVLLGDLILCLVSVAVILLWPGSVAGLWAGAMGLGLGMASIFPTMVSLAESRMTVTGRVASWFLVGSSVGSMTLPLLIGQLFESVGPLVTLVAIGAVLLAAVAVWAMLGSDKPRLVAEEAA